MNIDKFTQNSIKAVNGCQKIAMDYGNQEIVPAHLVYSLMTIDESLIRRLIEKMWIDADEFLRSVLEIIEKRPKVQGGEPFMGQVYMMIAFSIFPVIIVYLILSKNIVGGVSVGAVKG